MSFQKHKQYYRDKIYYELIRKHRKTNPLIQVFWLLNIYDFKIEHKKALEVFGMHGLWHTVYYVPFFDEIDLWEIDQTYARYAERLSKKVRVNCDDSIKAIKTGDVRLDKYDFISVDNPTGIYGEDYCEHFNLFPEIFSLLKKGNSLLLVNYISSIQYYENSGFYQDYFKRRSEFYKTTKNVVTPQIAIKAYRDYAKENGVYLKDWAIVPRNTIVNYLALMLTKD